jgi:hypothetical protein
MAVHPTVSSMLQESLTEYVYVAEWCVNYQKDQAWSPPHQEGGRLGYPAAVMMFCIVDTIGSFYRGKADFKVSIDGREVAIRKDGFQHFFVLNSPYYEQSLSKAAIEKIYGVFRNELLHNAALAPGYALVSLPQNHEPFPVVDGGQRVNIDAFLEISKKAVTLFLQNILEVVPGSQQEKLVQEKRLRR